MNLLRLSLIFCFSTLTISSSYAESVVEMSLEKFIDDESPYWQVDVSCTNDANPRTMIRPIDSEEWCSSDSLQLCDKNKYSLSRTLCSSKTTNQAVEPSAIIDSDKTLNTTTSDKKKADRTKLFSERVHVEEQRILIEQKKLELRRKELALQKRQLN